MTLEYEIGTYTRFRIEIRFFKGIKEESKAIFALDNVKVSLGMVTTAFAQII